MSKNLYEKMNILSYIKNPIYEQRESGVSHTSYNDELAFYSVIESGDTEKLKTMINTYENIGINTGMLSENTLTQVKYFAVSSVTLAVRAAIRGGVSEIYAYNLGDEVIRTVDKMTKETDIMSFLEKEVFKITEIVRISRSYNFPKGIKQCISYIDKNLHSKVTLTEIAKSTNFSEEYIGKYFKKHIGLNLKEYILQRKLNESKTLLQNGEKPEDVAYILGFSSQSHFISCFKKAFGITPKRYVDSLT